MLVPATPARYPLAPETGAKQDIETLAWFGTAYGRRVARDKPSLLPANLPAQATSGTLTAALNSGKPEQRPNSRKRCFASLVLLFAVLFAILVLKLIPFMPPPAFEPVRHPSPVEAAPAIEASRETAPDIPSSPIGAGRVTNVEAPPAGTPTAQRQEILSQEPERLSVDAPALSVESPSTKLEPAPSGTPPVALPPVVLLEAAKAPEVEARIVANPALAPVSQPDPVAVSEGRLPAPLPTAFVKAKFPKSDLPPSPPLNTPGKGSTNPDLAIGKALFARGDLLAARTAFEKAFELGVPAAALALGNTFDPVSLAKAGVKAKGDPAVARRWYRRAFELAMSRPTMRRPGRLRP